MHALAASMHRYNIQPETLSVEQSCGYLRSCLTELRGHTEELRHECHYHSYLILCVLSAECMQIVACVTLTNGQSVFEGKLQPKLVLCSLALFQAAAWNAKAD